MPSRTTRLPCERASREMVTDVGGDGGRLGPGGVWEDFADEGGIATPDVALDTQQLGVLRLVPVDAVLRVFHLHEGGSIKSLVLVTVV